MAYTIQQVSLKHERYVYGILELFGDLGGLLEILFLIGAFLVGPIPEYNFVWKALRKLYLAKTK
jgi:hypothetical protein